MLPGLFSRRVVERPPPLCYFAFFVFVSNPGRAHAYPGKLMKTRELYLGSFSEIDRLYQVHSL